MHQLQRMKTLSLLAITLAAGGVWADRETVGGYTWTYRINGDTAEVYKGSSAAISPKPTGTVTIPSMLGGKPVTSIGAYAFYNCKNLTSMTIPDGVTSIGKSAFYNCRALTSVLIPNGVTNVGERAFYGCREMASLTIGDGVVDIGEWAFYNCRALTSVLIPNGVTNVGDRAFYGCRKMARVTIGKGVTSIGRYAFSNCNILAEFVVSADNTNYKSDSGLLLTKDGATLVSGVNGDVVIPDGVAEVMNRAFHGRRGLTSVTIPGSVTNIANSAFDSCSGLVEFVVAADNHFYKSVSGLLLTEDGKTLVAGVNGDVVIPDGVTSIGDNAFDGRSGLTSVAIPDGVTSIGKSAFYDCSGLGNLTIPDSVTSIGGDAFYDCTGLGNLTIPNSVTSIGERAFELCEGLTSVALPRGLTNIGEGVFEFCKSLTSVTIPDGVTSIGAYAFRGCSELTSVTIPNSVTSVGDLAFSGCSSLTSMTIPSSVTSIGDRVFEGCSGLGEFVVAADNHVYMSVAGLLLVEDGKTLIAGVNGDVTIPDGVTRIEDYAFDGRSGLTSVTIPSSTTKIGAYAFYDCGGLSDIVFEGNAPTVGDSAFSGVSSDCKVHIRGSSSGWGEDASGIWNGMKVEMSFGGVVDDGLFGKAQTKNGALYNANGELVGTVELKFGRINARKGTVKVSASATLLTNGKIKKVTARAVTLKDGITDKQLVFKAPIGAMELSVAEDGAFTLKNYDYEMIGCVADVGAGGAMRVMQVGGSLEKSQMKFNIAIDSVPDFGKDGELLQDAMPNDEPIRVSRGTTWSFERAAALRYTKDRATGAYVLVGLDDPSKPNISCLKLSYTAKTGLFRGSFKLYTTNAATTPERRSPKLKKFTMNVVGLVVDGVGHGWATLKKPYAMWPVTVE